MKITLNGISYVIGDVYHVPELKNNLLSVGQLQEKALDVFLKEEIRIHVAYSIQQRERLQNPS